MYTMHIECVSGCLDEWSGVLWDRGRGREGEGGRETHWLFINVDWFFSMAIQNLVN